eukprot:CAMPEP_0117876596 /NCGR_PEP_ID=MMETSP0950-20121206/13660_1 /TAXON_ID=44440 /ORGANISM="Chattonella subsalsa, Strain CCMP2191" /LENGTH=682 /DNA_ID=CAMNT_0005730365 /DNA_START=62 /DNA_END=2110 /DNA_ORIENTATION=+
MIYTPSGHLQNIIHGPFPSNSAHGKQGPNKKALAVWFVKCFFPSSMALYGNDDGFRADLLEHPRQQWTTDYHKKDNPKDPDSDSEETDVLDGDVNALWLAISTASQITLREAESPKAQDSCEQHSGSATSECVHQQFGTTPAPAPLQVQGRSQETMTEDWPMAVQTCTIGLQVTPTMKDSWCHPMKKDRDKGKSISLNDKKMSDIGKLVHNPNQSQGPAKKAASSQEMGVQCMLLVSDPSESMLDSSSPNPLNGPASWSHGDSPQPHPVPEVGLTKRKSKLKRRRSWRGTTENKHSQTCPALLMPLVHEAREKEKERIQENLKSSRRHVSITVVKISFGEVRRCGREMWRCFFKFCMRRSRSVCYACTVIALSVLVGILLSDGSIWMTLAAFQSSSRFLRQLKEGLFGNTSARETPGSSLSAPRQASVGGGGWHSQGAQLVAGVGHYESFSADSSLQEESQEGATKRQQHENQKPPRMVSRRHPRRGPQDFQEFEAGEVPVVKDPEPSLKQKTDLLVPHWIQIGGSISFGKFTNGGGARFSWAKDGTVLPHATKSFYSISNVQIKDEGLYSCKVFNGTEERLWAEVLLRVSAPPVVRQRTVRQALRVNQTLALHASVQSLGRPSPEFHWERNGKPIGDHRATVQDYVVPRVTPKDSGTYTCQVYNVAGSVLWEEAVVIVTDY